MIDPYPPLDPPTGCDPIFTPGEVARLERERPGVAAFRQRVLGEFGGRDLGVGRECSADSSMHNVSRAWDWGPAEGEDLQSWQDRATNLVTKLTATDLDGNKHAGVRRLGIRNIIFNRARWGARERDWVPYLGIDPHTHHVHFDWSDDGAMGITSGYDGAGGGRSLAFPLAVGAALIALALAAWRLTT